MHIYLQALKSFFLKRNFDFDRPDIELYDFHPQMCLFLATNGVFFNKTRSLLRYVLPFFGTGVALAGTGMEIMFVWHFYSIDDYSLATECFCYTVIIGTIPVMYYNVFSNADKIRNIVKKMNNDFIVICKLASRYRRPFLEGQLQIWQLCWSWFIFVTFVGGLFMMMPIVNLLYQSLFVAQDEHTIRPLQFVMWLPYDDPYRSPNYEIFLIIQIFMCICFLQTFCVYIYTLFHILIHYYLVMDVIMLDFQVLFDGLDESVALLPCYDERRVETQNILNKRVKNIGNMHLSVFEAINTISSVYGPALVYQVLFSSILLCLIAYQIADKLDRGKLDILFCLLGIASNLQLWIPCYLGTVIRNKVGTVKSIFIYMCKKDKVGDRKAEAFAVGDSCWNCGWHTTSLGLLVRSDLILIIMRAQKPVTIKFTGLPNVQLETYSSLIMKAYSYFNMLQQYSR